MQRIHFTADDLARTRLRATAGPEIETGLAQELFARGAGQVYARWRRQVYKRLRAKQGPLSSAPTPADFWQAALAPYWRRVLAYCEAESEARGRLVMRGGVEQLFATLGRRVTWEGRVLILHDGPDEHVRLGGHGLVLSPSVFLAHRPARLFRDPLRPQAALVFSAPPDGEQSGVLWDETSLPSGALGTLVGQTRAAALQELRVSCTTGQLADRLGVSAPCVSQHTAVLRQSGLITTRRVRNTVVHTVTALGMALLEGKVALPAPVPERCDTPSLVTA
ncbi:winged helix-turn-helix domain-containing protein [Streptomyces parvus]|uniref:ArsR/SmtB family transcription factor n=1 Tax=Streptomyces parvus TaxID=66428 RepID=UPI00081B1145|nr:winged helix-turn-helix domain-containing protein [Streptomyces sp. Termitarium-T10T-6]SCD59274.1 Helix-turn-helix domain-containing protein [Streptomyces sp. Termitarium-T10T-6]